MPPGVHDDPGKARFGGAIGAARSGNGYPRPNMTTVFWGAHSGISGGDGSAATPNFFFPVGWFRPWGSGEGGSGSGASKAAMSSPLGTSGSLPLLRPDLASTLDVTGQSGGGDCGCADSVGSGAGGSVGGSVGGGALGESESGGGESEDYLRRPPAEQPPSPDPSAEPAVGPAFWFDPLLPSPSHGPPAVEHLRRGQWTAEEETCVHVNNTKSTTSSH